MIKKIKRVEKREQYQKNSVQSNNDILWKEIDLSKNKPNFYPFSNPFP